MDGEVQEGEPIYRPFVYLSKCIVWMIFLHHFYVGVDWNVTFVIGFSRSLSGLTCSELILVLALGCDQGGHSQRSHCPSGHSRSVLLLLPTHSHPGHLYLGLSFSISSLLHQDTAPSVRAVSKMTQFKNIFELIIVYFSPNVQNRQAPKILNTELRNTSKQCV